jgi:hypothetical protein
MTIEDKILKELEWQTKLMRAQVVTLTEIKFELQNARKLSETPHKKPSAWERFRYWLRGKCNC